VKVPFITWEIFPKVTKRFDNLESMDPKDWYSGDKGELFGEVTPDTSYRQNTTALISLTHLG